MLIHNGKLIVRAARSGLGTAALEEQLPGYRGEPLFQAFESFATADTLAKPYWWLATPDEPELAENPWDLAHRAAASTGYRVFVEPDLLHEFKEPVSVPPSEGFDPDWPPSLPASPVWHLDETHTGFDKVRSIALGDNCRIAHLDTGYWPPHMSTPVGVNRKLGWNFYENNSDTTDYGMTGLLLNPGHGTATMALLAGREMSLVFSGHPVTGYFGGAPKAEIVPVRISPSVIHVFTSMMARGIDYALAPRGDRNKKCHVITISMGGLPSASWAEAVNNVYDAGIVVVAAAGNNINAGLVDIPFHETVWPSRFDRVITAVGSTYDKTPYRTNKFGKMHGSYGPDSILPKTVAAFTPNVAWMTFKTKDEYSMNGGGTSSATPQIAAACALWLQKHGQNYPEGWRRVEACRTALFQSATSPPTAFKKFLGRGYLNVPQLLAQQTLDAVNLATLNQTPPDDARDPLWRSLTVAANPGIEEEMLEVEAAQAIQRSSNRLLIETRMVADARPMAAQARSIVLSALAEEPDLSAKLRSKLKSLQ